MATYRSGAEIKYGSFASETPRRSRRAGPPKSAERKPIQPDYCFGRESGSDWAGPEATMLSASATDPEESHARLSQPFVFSDYDQRAGSDG
jgi:hypothetical protein